MPAKLHVVGADHGIPERPQAPTPEFDNIPAELRALAAWVCWCYEWREDGKGGGKWDKTPYRTSYRLTHASCIDEEDWSSFEQARLALERKCGPVFDGVSMRLVAPYVGIDLDHIYAENGTFHEWASEIIDHFAQLAYIETSPSGQGVHIVCRGKPAQWGKRGRVEMYWDESPKFFTMTGTDGSGDIEDAQEAIDWLIAKYWPDPKETAGGGARGYTPSPAMTDEEVLDKARRAKNGEKFEEVWSTPGETGGSELDASLCGLLAFYTQDPEQLEALMRASERVRPKWDKNKTYLPRTIEFVLDNLTETYQPAREREAPRPNGNGEAASAGAPSPVASEDALALQFVDKLANEYRWCPGLGWMVRARRCWEADRKGTRWDEARLICREACKAATSDSERKRLASAKTVAAVLQLAQSDQRIVVSTDAWDCDPLQLNTPDGIVDLKSGTLRERTPDDLVTQCTAVSPDFKREPTLFLKFISEVFVREASMVSFMQRALGYCATGDRTEQVLMFFYGEGGNGKSTLLDLVLWLLGDYALKMPTAALLQSQHERHPTELAELRSKRLAVSSELEAGQFWKESLIKELTGDATLSVRKMRQDPFTITLTQKHIISGNNKPRLHGREPAIAHRLALVPFTQNFRDQRRDLQMLDKLKREGPAILAWIIEGAKQWATHKLQVPSLVTIASAEYLSEHDDIALWAMDCCVRDDKAKGVASDLYTSFRLWKERRGEHAISGTTWYQELVKQPGIKKAKTEKANVYHGIELTGDEAERVAAVDEPRRGGSWRR